MQEEIDPSQIPREYGGSSDRAMDDSDDERKVRKMKKGTLQNAWHDGVCSKQHQRRFLFFFFSVFWSVLSCLVLSCLVLSCLVLS